MNNIVFIQNYCVIFMIYEIPRVSVFGYFPYYSVKCLNKCSIKINSIYIYICKYIVIQNILCILITNIYNSISLSLYLNIK